MTNFPFRLVIETTNSMYYVYTCRSCDSNFAGIAGKAYLYSRFGNVLFHLGDNDDYEGWWSAVKENRESIEHLCSKYPELFQKILRGEVTACPQCGESLEVSDLKRGNDPIHRIRFFTDIVSELPDTRGIRIGALWRVPIYLLRRYWRKRRFDRTVRKVK